MNRYLTQPITKDLAKKLVILTGPRQAGKTTLSQELESQNPLYLNYDVLADRQILQNQSWGREHDFLVFDEIHKMPNWKAWLKGVVDAVPKSQTPLRSMLVTGSARMDTFRQSGESLAGRYFHWRLHPLSVGELTHLGGLKDDEAFARLMVRGGFPEPCLAQTDMEVTRWRSTYIDGLLREDILEFSRIHEVNAMRVFLDALRSRTGSPLSLASISRDMGVSHLTLKKYLDILEALYIVFVVRPWHRNITRATLQAPKVYFYDTGMVRGDAGVVFENLVACNLLKRVHWQQDAQGAKVDLHYIRTKDDAEVDFVLSLDDELTHLVECKTRDTTPHRALIRFAQQWPHADAVQLLADTRHDQDIQLPNEVLIQIRKAPQWLNKLGV
jgi:predicted AAA+ superfamily ATPase